MLKVFGEKRKVLKQVYASSTKSFKFTEYQNFLRGMTLTWSSKRLSSSESFNGESKKLQGVFISDSLITKVDAVCDTQNNQ